MLKLYYPAPATASPPLPSTTVLPSLYTATPVDLSSTTTLSQHVGTLNLNPPETSSQTVAPVSTGVCARLEGFERMTAADWTQDVRLITFTLPPGVAGSWQPGGIARIKPTNAESQVRRFFELQSHLEPDKPVLFARRTEVWAPTHERKFDGRSNGVYLPSTDSDSDEDFYSHHPPPLPTFATRPITPFEFVRRYVDLSAIPTRTFFQWLRLFATDERELERLDEFLDPVEGPVRLTLILMTCRGWCVTDCLLLSLAGRRPHVRDPTSAVYPRNTRRLSWRLSATRSFA